jgi:hypothetical protein
LILSHERDGVLVLDDHLAIDQGRFAGQLAANLDHPPIGSRPVIAVSGEGADLAAIDDYQGAVAVIFDLVNPSLSGGRFQHEGGDLRPGEAERRLAATAGILDECSWLMRDRKDV